MKKTILYIDDEQWAMRALVELLEREYFVISAPSGDRALQIIADNNPTIDLIITDVMMPNGQRIKTDDRGRTAGPIFARYLKEELHLNYPILCYTNRYDLVVTDEYASWNIKEIVHKSIAFNELMQKIKEHIR